MAFDFSAILKGIDEAIPVAAKAINVLKKKPKAVQEHVLQQVDPGAQDFPEPRRAPLFGVHPAVLLAAGGLVLFLVLRRRS